MDKGRPQRLVAAVVAGVGRQLGHGAAVESGAAGHIPGTGQQFGLTLGQAVKAFLHAVQKGSRHYPVDGPLDGIGVQILLRHPVAQMGGTISHDALNPHQDQQTPARSRRLHLSGRLILGAPDVDKVKPALVQQGVKAGAGGQYHKFGAARTAVHGRCDPGVQAAYRQVSGGSQSIQHAGQPAAAHLGGGEPAGCGGLGQGDADQP